MCFLFHHLLSSLSTLSLTSINIAATINHNPPQLSNFIPFHYTFTSSSTTFFSKWLINPPTLLWLKISLWSTHSSTTTNPFSFILSTNSTPNTSSNLSYTSLSTILSLTTHKFMSTFHQPILNLSHLVPSQHSCASKPNISHKPNRLLIWWGFLLIFFLKFKRNKRTNTRNRKWLWLKWERKEGRHQR